MNTPRDDAAELYYECFRDNIGAKLILEYARSYGEIHLFYENGTAANMFCLSEISDGDFRAKYLFAACTKPSCRNRGIFRKHMSTVLGDSPVFLIPESQSLFSMYSKMGFAESPCIEAKLFGTGGAKEYLGDVSQLYGRYESLSIAPKKDYHLFSATMRAHTEYGGKVFLGDGCIVLTDSNRVTEVIGDELKRNLSFAKCCVTGETSVTLPTDAADCLDTLGTDYIRKPFLMYKNINVTNLYINTLFN